MSKDKVQLPKYEDMQFFKPQEELVAVLVKKTQNNNPLFFRILTAYYFSKIASMMRVSIKTKDRGIIPVNTYAINLSVSGSGKGFSTNIIEEKVIHKFRDRYLTDVFPSLAQVSLDKIALSRAARDGLDLDDVQKAVDREFNQLGPLVFGFDSGTAPAVKQMRHKLLMADAGSINLEIDEIGSNLVGNVEVLNAFLELYDIGKIKQKLIKNTADNKRSEEIEGRTPTNMMLYGTPSKLLNGGKTEEEFYTMLETGFARRSIFGYARSVKKLQDLTAEQIYDMLTDKTVDSILDDLSNQLLCLADHTNFKCELEVSKEVTLELIRYQLNCQSRATDMREFDEIEKAEMEHRYYKALKLAGTYAFIDSSFEILSTHLYAAIKLVEESGRAFKKILTRPRVHERVAKYLASVCTEVTQVDLMEDLPFYRGSVSQRRDIMLQAIAWGYRNNIVIKTSFSDTVEFFKGESLKETELDSIIVSYSQDLSNGYIPAYAEWTDLHKLMCHDDLNYTAHHFSEQHRNSQNLIKGFNLAILDIDGTMPLQVVRKLLANYTYLIATTKRHTKQKNRYRVILPLSHVLKLNSFVYSKFMCNLFDWLPFEVDTATKDCARKWSSFKGEYYYNNGDLLDALPFIPDTSKQAQRKQSIVDMQSLSNLERWFLLGTGEGNRSNMLIRYAYILIDGEQSFDAIRAAIHAFNIKLKKPLATTEIDTTIMVSVASKLNRPS